ncbi:S-adenosyl-L-methionine-dependent methyltransferase [Rhizodiscina lignyota]|uniref:S-adenosyl-L-methionine-dependent methyltransferase n=1 Tax=Rhizodiscina lignyota TaxID=1504668 RepID=A0A9P4IMH9_9PEZI|nr:S-adenosyl-L-methionine-dependent methyltransferase [Rhizodiscina lignyota]
MADQNLSLKELSQTIAVQTDILTNALSQHGEPNPSFNVAGPSTYPFIPEVQAARSILVECASKLLQLANGPEDFIVKSSLQHRYNFVVMAALVRYKILETVPLDGSISYADLAAKVGLPENRIFRFLRYARALHLFYEPKPGFVAHTSFSAAAVKKRTLQAFMTFGHEQTSNVNRKIFEVLEKYGDSQSIEETAIFAAYDIERGQTFWDFCETDGEGDKKGWRMRMAADCLEAGSSAPTFSDSHVHAVMDWDSLGDATIVDVGGNSGHTSIALAKGHLQLKIIVQDLPGPREAFEKLITDELRSRVTFQAHSFFEPQPVREADVYFLRVILHDWPDKSAIDIVRQLVEVMKPTSRITLMESIVPESDENMPSTVMHLISALDIEMMTNFNSKERTMQQWCDLMKAADKRLVLKSVGQSPGSALTGLVFGFE